MATTPTAVQRNSFTVWRESQLLWYRPNSYRHEKRCPAGLVYNEKAGYCDYPEYCSSDRTEPLPGGPGPVQPPALSPPPLAVGGDCAGRPNGYYSNGCSADFIHCNEGVATVMHCPSSLVFNEAMGYCDYPAVCSSPGEPGYAPQEPSKPSKPQISFVCPKPSGVFSVGCTVEFVVCLNALPQLMTCPEGLVFNALLGCCDLKDKCSEGETAKPPATNVTSPASDYKPPEISNECANLPDGKFGSQCGSTFMVCSNGVSYSMSCPSGLVFDAKTNRCVYPEECGGKSEAQSPAESTTPSYIPQTTRNDCVGKPDGIHSLGCVNEFLQCVDGRPYSLYCPAGLVFVEKSGVCDVPSACKEESKPENVTGPVSYEPVVESKPGMNETSLVFNYRKSACDYVENCAGVQKEEPKPTVTLPVPDTEVNQDNTCQDKPDGIVTDVDCQPQFTTCLSGIAYVTKCPAGLVYSVKAKVCDYPEACGKTYDQPSTPAPVVQAPEKPNVDYQDTSVGSKS
ncbi:chitin binding Peritrophin-A domain protein [Oesophagostomum dentatum]|uniref:Chitin binding Peritrophin-A domain protein n=1 Tax=Oesophagostomum dentatum TaxID=61180 RepID=A0A0B1TBR1_OESDE|nr:chitin binding Peritrophin-A domain protein [Oesophagostomum dentatum]